MIRQAKWWAATALLMVLLCLKNIQQERWAMFYICSAVAYLAVICLFQCFEGDEG